MSDPQIRIEVHGCAACGAAVIDQERHLHWHAAAMGGAGRELDDQPNYELIGLVEPPRRPAAPRRRSHTRRGSPLA